MKRRAGLKAAGFALYLLAAGLPAAAGAQEDEGPALPVYKARAVPSPSPKATYLLPDKSVYILANDLVGPFLEKIDAIFMQAHPNIRITLNPLGSEPGLAALTSGKSAFTPLGREGLQQDLQGFTALHGYAPTSLLLGYDQSPDPDIFPPGKVPSAVWINSRNPLPKLTVKQAAGIFTSGLATGEITHWSQLGVKGEWGRREIHVYLPAKRDSAFLFIDGYKMGGRPWTRRAEWVDASTDVMAAVAQDPFGIGIVGFWPPDSGWDRQAELAGQAKLVPLAENDDARFSHAGVGDVYPFTGAIRVYFNQPPGQPLEPWINEYMRLALSKQGQEILGSMTREEGYIPLEHAKALEELAKLK